MAMANKAYPRTGDTQTIYLKNVITNPNIEVGDYTIYNDFVSDPKEFENNNVLYHYPINGDKLIIGKFCSIACGAKFLQFAPSSGHWCVCQRPLGGAQRPPLLRFFDRLNDNNVVLRCPLHYSVG